MRFLLLGFLALLSAAVPVHSDESTPLSRIAFGSCARQDKPQPIWDAIVAVKPQLYLSLGDAIYGDSQNMTVLKKKYDQLAAITGFQSLRKTCPLLATWDDHDFGVNDGGAEYPQKDASQQLFLDFFGVPKDSPRRKQRGVYHAALFGPPDQRVQVILLDTRYFRSPLKKKAGKMPFGTGNYEPNFDKAATLLGEDQWRWLAEQLKVPAKVRLLVSSIQVVAQDHGWEKWQNFPHERDRLFQLLRATKAAGVLCLSGDRHLAELSVMDAEIDYPLYDLTSSGLTEASPRWRRLEVNRHRVATMNRGNNFGLLVIDWGRQDPLIRLQIRDENGEVTIQEKLPLSLLQPGSVKSRPAGSIVRINDQVMTAPLLKQLLKQEVTLVMKVAATGASKKNELLFLNSSADRQSEDNFTVVLDRAAQAGFRAQGVANLRTHFENRWIRVAGSLSTFAGRPQIVVSAAEKVQFVTEMK